ncbi:MAG: prepilin-type N-terminal cleavage/methylation domain-containing protein, partial [Myxococcales bacterium]|nr:prepilin-type N-terminal cleavage/methylation domain-containing protein [Myxococcales bacterium]
MKRGDLRPRGGWVTKNRAFTLIELMIAVAIIGVLASIGLPMFSGFVKETKASEGYTNLGLLSRAAAAYYEREFGGQDLTSTSRTHCSVEEPGEWIGVPPFPPVPEKRTGNFSQYEAYQALTFDLSDPLYFVYGFENVQTTDGDPTCGTEDGEIYMFTAASDLDGDGLMGGLVLYAGAENGVFRRASGFTAPPPE